MPDGTITTPAAPAPLKYERTSNFISTYANSVYFEASAWDLKLIFGQLDQTSANPAVQQNVAITVPWAQAKLALFWLRLHIEVAEVQVGKFVLRKDVIPPEAPALTPEQEKDDMTKITHDLYVRLRDEFLKNG